LAAGISSGAAEEDLFVAEGKLYGIGVGPGDPELLTLKAVKIMGQVQLVIVPKGDTGEQSVARQIISPFLKEGQWVEEFTAPMTRDRQLRSAAWDQLAERVERVLASGQEVAFVTLGDSTVYSTYFYLIEALLRRGADFQLQTVPGITSFSAAAAMINQALTLGSESLAVVPADRGLDYIRQALANFDNVVLMKVIPQLDQIIELLAELSRLDQAAYVSRCGMPGQFVKESLAAAGEIPRDYFSLILVQGNRDKGVI
jgi:precorrin-2/cobalt-factor-2 C20-methyltransferase